MFTLFPDFFSTEIKCQERKKRRKKFNKWIVTVISLKKKMKDVLENLIHKVIIEKGTKHRSTQMFMFIF
jgi:hypothetical protein